MPQYGPDLFSSDVGSIMRDEYKMLLSYKYSTEDILSIFKDFFLKGNKSKRDHNLFWLIMAKMQVNYGELLEEVRENALKVIDSQEDIKQWEEYVIIEKHISSVQSITNELLLEGANINFDDPTKGADQFLQQFQNKKDQKLKEYLENDDIPTEVLEYFNDNGFSKIEVFGEDGKKHAKKRVSVIKDLREDIVNFSPKVKKIAKPFAFDPGWRVGDVYAYKLTLEEDKYNWLKDAGLYGKYILFEVIGINKKPISRIVPTLAYDLSHFVKPYTFIGEDLPTDKELNQLEYMKKHRIRHNDNFERLGRFYSDRDEVYVVGFYGETRKFKKMNLIKLRTGIKTYSEEELNTVGHGHVFVTSLPFNIANNIKHMLNEKRNIS